MKKINRRNFVKSLVAGVSVPYLASTNTARANSTSVTDWSASTIASRFENTTLNTDSSTVFDLSIASGDPTSSGVILWTHITPSEYSYSEPLFFQVAIDEAFELLLVEGEIQGHSFGEHSDFTVKVDIDGKLGSNQRYYYRFIYKNTVSKTGRCKTTPTIGEQPDNLKFGVLTCQDYTNGYYGALNYLAEDDSIDFVLHLGDFIYESVGDPAFQDLPFEDRLITLPSSAKVALNIEDYRHLYKTYRSDPYLQKALENHTWIFTTDDHETCNDCYWDYEQDTLGCPDHPYNEEASLDLRRQLKLDSQRAWAEYIPARIEINPLATHPHDYSKIYRHVQFGDLLNLYMLDTRTYRTAHPCGEGTIGERYLASGCQNTDNPDQSMLGREQREWLISNLATSNTRWNVLGNQTYMGRLGIDFGDKLKIPFNTDAWDGYTAERQLLMNELSANDVNNFVVLTGDLHSYIASEIKKDYQNIYALDFDNYRGVEFMTPSVTSAGLADALSSELADNQLTSALLNSLSESAIRLSNSHIKMFNSVDNGYSTIEFKDSYCEWIGYKVDKNVNATGQGREAISRFRKYEAIPWMTRLPTFGY